MFFKSALALAGAAVLPAVIADYAISPGFDYGSSSKVRGVSLGGWLVTEAWITPSLYDNTGNDLIIDEWTFGLYQDYDTAYAALKQHWDTFYIESDFANIAAAGLNHIRIPIGYWAFEVGPGEPFITGQLPYLKKAVDWAHKYGLKVIVDLHGAPGSQNGFDNSGHTLSFPGWHSNATNVQRTDNITKTLASMFAGKVNVVPMINPLNEPAGFDGDAVLTVVEQFWYDSYGNIRYPYGTSEESNTVLLIHDAFQNLSYWAGFMDPPNWQGVAMDTHIYEGFTAAELSRTEDEHIASVCSQAANLSSFHLWIVVGEWSPAVTDCAVALNGRGLGAHYDGTYPNSTFVGSCDGWSGAASGFSSSYKTFLRKFWEAQVISFEAGAGWLMWTWKTEAGAGEEWSYSIGLEYGWIPQDPTDHLYPDVCS